MKKIISYLFLLFPACSFAQPAQRDITGVWKGTFYVDSTKMTCLFELSISEEKGKYTGYSRIAFDENGIHQVVYRDHAIRVEDNMIIVEDKSQLTKASSIKQPGEVKKVMTLTLTVQDTVMQLTGTWATNKTRRYLSATGSATVQRKTDFKSTDIFKKLDELALTDKLSFNKPQEEEPVKNLSRFILSDLAEVSIPKKRITARTTIAKPDPQIKPKQIPFVWTSSEPVPVKEPVVAKAEIKKPVVQAQKQSQPVATAKTVTTKTEKAPPVTKPATVTETKTSVVTVPAIKKNNLPDQSNAAVDVSKRTNSSIQSLYFKADSLQLTLYDNGEVDGDTVSVLLNGKIIIAKQGLTTKPNVHTIYFDRDTPDSQMLVMYAENLGAIPPNTGLLVVREGQSVYEVRFSADLKTNAAIVLRRKKDE